MEQGLYYHVEREKQKQRENTGPKQDQNSADHTPHAALIYDIKMLHFLSVC